MAIAASYVASNQFSVAADKVARFAAGRRVLADCGTDGEQYGTVLSVASTTVTMTMDSGNALTANLVSVQHGNDIPASLANHGHTGPADGGNIYATTSESQAGTSTTKAVTPAGLAAWFLAAVGIGPGDLALWKDLGTASVLDISLLGPKAVTWDAPSCAAGAQVSTTAAIPGAEMGDRVYVTCGTALAGLMLRGEVTAQDVVTMYLYNPTGSAVDLASATYYVTVWQLTPGR